MATPAVAAAEGVDEQHARTTVEEVVVTAEKRNESSRLVPASITALSGDTLERGGVTSYADIAARAPGFYVTSGTPGIGVLRIRGLSSSAGGPLVAVMVNGVAIGSSATFARSSLNALDLNPFDVERVEVLRGPQGTLYGANSIGGILSYVTKEPDLNDVEAAISAEMSHTRHGGLNNVVRGAVNLPLEAGQAAIRVSAYRDFQEGFLDNSRLGRDNINSGYVAGARGELLLRPEGAPWSIRVGAIYQDVDRNSTNEVVYSRKPFKQIGSSLDQPMRVPAAVQNELKQAYVVADWTTDGLEFVSTTSYAAISVEQLIDYSAGDLVGLLDGVGKGAFGPAVPLAPALPQPPQATLLYAPQTHKFVQEFLLRSAGESNLKWMVGGYHTQEYAEQTQTVTALTPDYRPAPGLERALYFTLLSEYTENAVFANGTYSITPKLDFTAGVRHSRISQTYRQLGEGASLQSINALLAMLGTKGLPLDTGDTRSKHSQTNYLFNLRYRFDGNSIVYVRAASGYRPGGPNVSGAGLPETFQPDSAWSYEIGTKLGFWQGRGTLDLAAYYIDWKDFQTLMAVGGISGFANANGATSQGVEAALTIVPTPGLTLTATTTYIDTALTHDEPAFGGKKGEAIPDTPKWGGSLLAEYTWELGNDWWATAGGVLRYVGEQKTGYSKSTAVPPYTLEDYTLLDLTGSLERGRYRIGAYIRNVTDERPKLSVASLFGTPFVGVQRPRTAGISLTFRY